MPDGARPSPDAHRIPAETRLVQTFPILDDAVAAAYGWDANIGEDKALEQLLALNLALAT